MEKFTYGWRSWLYQFSLIFIALSFLSGGVWLTSINWLGYEWFSRSGSIVVVLGVISGFGGIFLEQVLRSRLIVQERIALLKARRKFRSINAPEEYATTEISRIEKHFDDLEQGLQQALKIRAGALEFILVIVGTLVWAFGDILMNKWFLT
ncbi:hypothetical protein [Planctobacterium marinum]|uniref:Uncharacterized protein n=1 Tax=Planctobacterium marinum TaxID=1631968 RepID=A0AA48HYR5_9ALTE|nr:hypothetical protein MACH26_25960 [Planctobacterium marinum]